MSCCFDVSLSDFREHRMTVPHVSLSKISSEVALISLEEYRENEVTATERKVDPSLMPCRAVLGWNFKQQHLVDRRTVGPCLLDTVLISRVGWRVGLSKACR